MKLRIKRREEKDDEEVVEKKSTSVIDEGDDESDKLGAAMQRAPWFKQGFKAAKKEIDHNKSRASWTPDFWVKADEEATVRLMGTDPLCVYSHRVRLGKYWRERTCLEGTGEKCPLCEAKNKRRFVGCFSVIDRRKESWTGKDGKKVTKEGQVKIWRAGQKVVSQLDMLTAKRGTLTNYDIIVSRSGTGLDTVYSLLPESPSPLDENDMKKKPLDLMKVLAPKKRAELLAELGQTSEDEDEVASDVG